MIFPGSHAADFDAVLTATEPFALVRFGDGEVFLMQGKKYQSADAWATNGPSWLKSHLEEALAYVAPGYCIGLPAPCCLSAVTVLRCPTPRERTTFATLFLHGNLKRVGELVMRYRDAFVVGPWVGADVRIPGDSVSQQPVDLDLTVSVMQLQTRPILVAAGPLANVLVHRYWARQPPELRQICLDVGSPLDVLRGKKTRHYHEPTGPLWEHHCAWDSQPAPWLAREARR